MKGNPTDPSIVRCLALILALSAALQSAPEERDSSLLLEERAWRGWVEVSSKSLPPPGGKGAETQTERIDFLITTKPPRRTVGWAKLIFTQRETKGRYELAVDTREGKGKKARATKGGGAGRLHAKILGFLEPKTRKYRLAIQATPQRLVGRQTISGFAQGHFTTWRNVVGRKAFLAGFDQTGLASKDLRVMEGERTLTDTKARLQRTVKIRWRVERIDPVISGKVVDHHGRPLAGVTVEATTTDPNRIRRGLPPRRKQVKTGDDGTFRIDAWWAHWSLRALAERREMRVLAGAAAPKGVQLRFDSAPETELRMPVYALQELPAGRKLIGHFQNDVGRYLEWIAPRVSKARLAAALTPPTKR